MIMQPLGYMDFLMLEQNSSMIITDSGGVQKEAFMMKIPCAVLRNETEWHEPLKYGKSELINVTNIKLILKKIKSIKNKKVWNHMPYGRGDASKKIAKLITRFVK